MRRPTGRRRLGALAVLLLLPPIVATLALPGRLAAQVGIVRIHNRTPQPVEILVQHVDAWGARQWRVIAEIPPRQSQEFPSVPAGAVFGARSGARQWRPFAITYPPGAPIFEYTLFPAS